MKNKVYITIILLIVAISIFFSISSINNLFVQTTNNVVNINDVLGTICESPDNSYEYALDLAKKYNLDITILDNNENFLVTTNNNMSKSINDAIKNHDTILDIKSNNNLMGKLIVDNNQSIILKNNKTKIYLIIFSCYVLLIIVSSIFYFYLHNKIINPFKKLKDFALRIANGNLDIPLNMDKNNLFGAFTESFDIMREELKIARENERKATESKKELVASLSHDIKTPVASIKAISQLLQVYQKDSKNIDRLKIIESKSDQIELLINNLFHATLEELEELKVNPSEENSTIIEDLIKNADFNNLVSDINIPRVIIKCDKLRLGQIIDNIISNSYKYAKTKISVISSLSDNYLEISFNDYGKGINEDELPLLCQKFYRGNNSKGENGSGLGLYISKYLINKMDGDLTVNNIISNNTIIGFSVTIKLYIY